MSLLLLPKRAAGCILLGALVAALLTASNVQAAPWQKSLEESVGDGDLDADDLVGRATVGPSIVAGARGAGAWLSLSGFTRHVGPGEREIGGFLAVGVPLDRMATVAARTSSTSATAADMEATLTPRLSRATVEAAWRAASLGPDDARLDSILSRARWSAALPETRLRATRIEDQRLSTDASLDASRLRDSTGANVGFEARLTWRLDRLVYADDEPAFERMRLERHDARARIAGRVLESLFHWHRASLEMRWAQAASRDAREARPSRDEIEATLRMTEAEATLDVLTAGWFSSTRSRGVLARPTAVPVTPVLPDAL